MGNTVMNVVCYVVYSTHAGNRSFYLTSIYLNKVVLFGCLHTVAPGLHSLIQWFHVILISFTAFLFVELEAISMLWFSSACLWARLTSLHFPSLGLSSSWKERLVKSCSILILFYFFVWLKDISDFVRSCVNIIGK